MPEYINRLLRDVQKNPGIYLGKKSLERLVFFLSGYMYCMDERSESTAHYLPGFQEFIEEYYNIQSVHHWSEIIRFFCVTEEDAFDEFYRLLDEFYK